MSMNLDSASDSSNSYNQRDWVYEFLNKKGNEYFCDVDEDYILDKFNLTDLSEQVLWFPASLNVITDRFDFKQNLDLQTRESLSASAVHLYGLIHARFILSAKGLQKMADKFRHRAFGCCPRALCRGAPIIPVGLHDEPGISSMKLYCYLCQDIYNPPKLSSRRPILDGAYWGTSYAHILVQTYSNIIRTPNEPDIYVPKVFGFAIHEHNNIQKIRLRMKENSDALQGHMVCDKEPGYPDVHEKFKNEHDFSHTIATTKNQLLEEESDEEVEENMMIQDQTDAPSPFC